MYLSIDVIAVERPEISLHMTGLCTQRTLLLRRSFAGKCKTPFARKTKWGPFGVVFLSRFLLRQPVGHEGPDPTAPWPPTTNAVISSGPGHKVIESTALQGAMHSVTEVSVPLLRRYKLLWPTQKIFGGKVGLVKLGAQCWEVHHTQTVAIVTHYRICGAVYLVHGNARVSGT